ncbi:Dual specificity protein phosphatase PHS1 [Hibiscus syriacus]|uniref:Dual specificity protein phosphatase PHS1 n=1 Tax=Hibiscus syriacus TaxID=106335 RepID=A0A6A3BXG3_HIBSY|nr:Dual specificity protein phosphatase PHS1 [Hibiscus syriacus]
MAQHQKDNSAAVIINPLRLQVERKKGKEEEKELDLGSYEPEAPLPLTVTSRVFYMLGDITEGPAYRFSQWLELVRKRNGRYRSSGFRNRHHRLETMPSCAEESFIDSQCVLSVEQPSEPVTINSGGVVLFALFNQPIFDDNSPKEAAAVIKFSSSRMATQSERLGYEFEKWLGIRTPQARVVHNSSPEWLQIKEAAQKTRVTATQEGDEVGEVTCSELLEALELSRCLFMMSYVHGSPLLESSSAFYSRKTAERTASALGRVLMLVLVIRNEDRLPCRQLRWRGNPANLLLTEKTSSSNIGYLDEAFDSAMKRFDPRVMRAIQKERRASSIDRILSTHSQGIISQSSDLSDITESPRSCDMILVGSSFSESFDSDSYTVAIDSGVPRRPPVGKRANDQVIYPKSVELLLNSSSFSTNLLHDITCGKLGSPEDTEAVDIQGTEMTSVIQEFRSGFRAALRDLQGFHIFLLMLHQKLVCVSFPSTPPKELVLSDNQPDCSDTESQRSAPKTSSSGHRESMDYSSPLSREGWHGKFYKGIGEPLRSLRLTAKLRDFNKSFKVDAESSKDLEQWNEMLKNDSVKLCQENNFNTGFFEGSDNNSVVDADELKVRLEHILERIALISEAANTEKPSLITRTLFIGGALAARSAYTLQHFGITHVLCLCSNEIGQADSQYNDLFEYKNFSIYDNVDSNISSIFEEVCDFIDHVEQIGGRVLVHCFEGKSRTATVMIAYLMLRKNLTLLEAWNSLKRAHRRAQPNDGFARILLDLDRKLQGKVSMEWHQRKPMMKVCPFCGKNAGLSSSSLKLHLQKAHKKLSSGSVDSAMTMEIQKALDALRINRGGSLSPTQRQFHSVMDE